MKGLHNMFDKDSVSDDTEMKKIANEVALHSFFGGAENAGAALGAIGALRAAAAEDDSSDEEGN